MYIYIYMTIYVSCWVIIIIKIYSKFVIEGHWCQYHLRKEITHLLGLSTLRMTRHQD